jgi:hypothetical protein
MLVCLQEGKDEPVASVAAAVGLEGSTLEDDVHIEKYNTAIQVRAWQTYLMSYFCVK